MKEQKQKSEKGLSKVKENMVDALEKNKVFDTEAAMVDGAIVCFSLFDCDEREETLTDKAPNDSYSAPPYNAVIEFPQCELD
ncbi:MAG: hypothetical protein E7657_02825 [Ruminococcaceae bacterium]|nr:hypothetical protein [Oscillospiraceae bacterium]